jgi:hypothetical protein
VDATPRSTAGASGVLRDVESDSPARPRLGNASLSVDSSRVLPRVFQRYSLRALARAQLNYGPGHRLRHIRDQRLPRWTHYALFACGIGILFLPVHTSIGPFGDPKTAEGFLNTQWLVVAAMLGFAVALVGIVMGAFLSSARNTAGLTLREFATELRYTPVVYLGVLAIILNGMALFPLGTAGPGGWPGAWATCISALAVIALPLLFEGALDVLEPRRLIRARTRRLDRDVTAVVYTQLLRLASMQLVQEGHSPFLGVSLTAPEGNIIIRATRSGRVTDIRVRRLEDLSERHLRGAPIVLTGIDLLERMVDSRTELAAIPPGSDLQPRAVRRAFRLSRGQAPADQELIENLEGLHQQATQAIRIGDQQQWDGIAEGYRTVLLAMPRAAADYGLAFAGAVANPSFLPVGPMDRIARWLFDEARLAVELRQAELAFHIASFSMSVAFAAESLGAQGLVEKMLTIYPQIYALASSDV